MTAGTLLDVRARTEWEMPLSLHQTTAAIHAREPGVDSGPLQIGCLLALEQKFLVDRQPGWPESL